jgi:hypothetical protein
MKLRPPFMQTPPPLRGTSPARTRDTRRSVGCAAVLLGLALHAAAAPPRLLARQTGLDETVVEAASAVGTNLRRLMGTNARGLEQPARGVTVEVPHRRAASLAEELRRQLDAGHVVFVSQRRHGIDQQPDEVSVVRSNDPLEPLRIMNTSGPNYHLSARRVMAKLRAWDRRYGLQLIGAGHDWVEARLKKLPADLRAFAVEVYEFCPDAVSEVQSVDRLMAELQLTRTLYLRWD